MPPEAATTSRPTRGGTVFVEVVRLAVVVLATAVALEAAGGLLDAAGRGDDLGLEPETVRLSITVVGAGLGYVLGGALGRFALGRVDAAEGHLAQVSGGQLVAALLGALGGMVLAAALTWPVLLLGGRTMVAVPLAGLVITLLVAGGARLGFHRGGDLLRYVGASGRLDVSSPSRGTAVKVVDTSALVDGRLLDVARTGFLEGTLVVPRFVLFELQGLADAGDEERRARGHRGLDVLAGLQRSAGVAVEVADRDYPEVAEVDAKLLAMAEELGAALVTVDGNLARIAEVQGVRVRNLNALADTLRPPVLPGEVLDVKVTRRGREAGQGVGHLADGTMVVVESAADHVGEAVGAEVTSILSNPHGRMVFATRVEATPLRRRVAGEPG
ncbi:MAG: TRAM domain-containing protein [Egibacteraceae bacterium]